MVNQSMIKVSKELKLALEHQKIVDNETFEDVIWDLIEDRLPLSKETLKAIEESKKDFADGKTYTLDEICVEDGFSL